MVPFAPLAPWESLWLPCRRLQAALLLHEAWGNVQCKELCSEHNWLSSAKSGARSPIVVLFCCCHDSWAPCWDSSLKTFTISSDHNGVIGADSPISSKALTLSWNFSWNRSCPACSGGQNFLGQGSNLNSGASSLIHVAESKAHRISPSFRICSKKILQDYCIKSDLSRPC